MKIKAHAKNSKGELIIDANTGKPKIYYVWDVLDKRDNNPVEYKKENLTYVSTFNSNIEMIAKLPGSFAYKSKATSSGVTNKDSELVSHEMVIQVLEELGTINFQIGSEVFPFEFETISSNDLKVKFGEKDYYYPDLVGRFKASDDNPYYEKWGGKVSIEVTVTHACEPIKLVEFRRHSMAIIEVKVSDKLRFHYEQKGQKKSRKSSYSSKDLKNYYNFLHQKLSSGVYASILSDPISNEYHNRVVDELRLERQNLIKRHKKLISEYNAQESHYEAALDAMEEEKSAYQTSSEETKLELSDLKKEIPKKLKEKKAEGKREESARVRAMGFWKLLAFWKQKK